MTKQITIVEPMVVREYEDIQLVVEISDLDIAEYKGWYILLMGGEVMYVSSYDSLAFKKYEALVISKYIN